MPYFLYQSLAAVIGIGDDAFELRILWQHRAEDRGIEFALEQHLGHVLAVGGALDAVRIAEFGHVGILEGHPFHLADIDAIILPQDAADPAAGGLREGAHADSAALEVSGVTVPRSELYSKRAVLKAAHHGRRHQHERLAESLALQIGDERHLADVEFLLAHHHGERLVDRIDLGEAERDAIGFDLAALQRLGLRIGAETAADGFDFFGSRRAHWTYLPKLA